MFKIETKFPKLAKKHHESEAAAAAAATTKYEDRVFTLPKSFISPFDHRQTQSNLDISTQLLTKMQKESLNTTKELRNSILSFRYGGAEEELIQNDSDMAVEGDDLERENTLKTFGTIRENNMLDSEDKVRPGHTAKRYLSNWTKYWQPEMVLSLVTKGKLVESSMFEQALKARQTNDKRRLEDNISRIPAPYRLQKEWQTDNDFLKDFENVLENIQSNILVKFKDIYAF
jgi:hypothetical protein